MNLSTLVRRNLLFFWRTNLAIVTGVAVAGAVLSGALLVGQSVRESLRSLLFQRIGSTEYLLAADSFFGDHLAGSISSGGETCPVIYLKGVLVRESSRVRAYDVNVYGVDERFWRFHGLPDPAFPDTNSAAIGAPLARQLDIKKGDALLLRVEAQQAIPREWLYGRRDSVGRTIRLNCAGIIDESRLGEFAIYPSQGRVFSMFVPLKRLQKDLAQLSKINTILLSSRNPNTTVESIRDGLRKNCALEDMGLKLRALDSGKGFSLESSSIILDDSVVRAGIEAAAGNRMNATPIYTYLANSIKVRNREIPYSVITAAEIGKGALSLPQTSQTFTQSSPLPADDSIWLTDWASRDLGAAIGDTVEIEYYIWQESGQLSTRTARFQLAGILSMAGLDASWAPDIPGITEARSISEWDPPFPLDLSRIRRQDEDFWNRYRATPKAFITLTMGRKLWQTRFGRTTALRITFPEGIDTVSGRERFASALLRHLDPERAGFSINAIRERGLAASQGSTDFGEYFVYFSSFLVAAAILVSVLFFKLMVEQRVREIGILRAAGMPVRMIRNVLISEGAFLSMIGSILGLAGATGYGWLMIAGLRTWWSGAVGTHRIHLHVDWVDLLLGAAAAVLFSLAAIVWTLRGLQRNSPRMLLSGVLESAAVRVGRTRKMAFAAILSLAAATLLLISSATGRISQLEGFFGSGFLLLISILCSTALYLRRRDPMRVYGNGLPAFLRLGVRNSMHRPGRSLVCASLIASAIFIVISMEAFRLDLQKIPSERNSGTGGYALMGESALPVIHDPNTDEGREALGINSSGSLDPKAVRFTSFRERPGDDASCLNLYAPQEPKILGAPNRFLAEGRFSFQSSPSSNSGRNVNPWLLLESSPDKATIPAIADANTIQYILHLSVGSELTVRGDDGNPVRLRLVAALKDSIFQGELLISESNFLRVFGDHQGFRFFLLDLPNTRAGELRRDLQESMSDWGLALESPQERLAAYHRVENTYLSTFQSLGTLGLVLGTIGLAAILLRNVLERRQELAILRAVGYRRSLLSGLILWENVLLLLWGLASGAICAFLAVIPALQSRGASFPFAVSGLILLAVLAAGLVSSLLAVIAALRAPLLSALRSE